MDVDAEFVLSRVTFAVNNLESMPVDQWVWEDNQSHRQSGAAPVL